MARGKKQLLILAGIIAAILIYSSITNSQNEKAKQDAIDAVVTVQLLPEDYIEENPDVRIYSDFTSEKELNQVLVTLHQDLNDLQLVSVEVEGLSSGGYKCLASEEILSTGPIAAEESIIIEVSKPDCDPERGIVLISDIGTPHNYFVFFNGSDMKPFLWTY